MADNSGPYTLILSAKANDDIDRATIYFDSRRLGLGAQFFEEFLEISRLISLNPEMCEEKVLFVRRGIMKRFRFHIFYAVDSINQVIDIIGILHQKQDPDVLLERLNIEF